MHIGGRQILPILAIAQFNPLQQLVHILGKSSATSILPAFTIIHRKCETHTFGNRNLIINSGSNLVKDKINELVTKYEQITGMDEVRRAQNRVIEAQDKFVLAQEKRRGIIKDLTQIQNKLKEVYAELDATTRGEERYLHLVTKEHNILKEERALTAEFNLYEREERECFSLLSSSVKDSHEKERAQAERTKYWSVIGSIIGTVIGVVGSSINNEFKMKELRKLVIQSTEHSQRSAEADSMAATILTRHENQLKELVNDIKTIHFRQHEHESNDFSGVLHNLDHSPAETTMDAFLAKQKRETRLVLAFSMVFIPVVVVVINKVL